MKPHLGIVCGFFYPDPSPTGQCVRRFIDLLHDDFQIDVICLSDSGMQQEAIMSGGTRVYTLCGKRMMLEAKAVGWIKRSLHLFGGLQIKTHWLGNLRWFRYAAAAKLNDLHIEHAYDCVMTVCSPMAAHLAGMDFKIEHPSVRHIAYTVDPYTTRDRKLPFFVSFDRSAKREKRILAKADTLLLSEEIYQNRLDLYESAVPLPYILPPLQETVDKPQSEYIDCVYAGRFYEDIRNPEQLLRTFASLNNRNIRLHLFSVGCEDIVQAYADSNDNIVPHTTVSHEEITRIYRYADVLVNVGNTDAEFLPSKTFEYIAARKPILHFSANSDDCPIINHYPLAFQVKPYTNKEAIEAFLSQSKGKAVSEELILSIYKKHTKEHLRAVLMSVLLGS